MTDAFERAAARAETESRRCRRKRSTYGQRKAFKIHAAAFLAGQILIFAAWLLQWQMGGTAYPWFIYPLLGWGIGLAAHYATAHDSFKKSRRD